MKLKSVKNHTMLLSSQPPANIIIGKVRGSRKPAITGHYRAYPTNQRSRLPAHGAKSRLGALRIISQPFSSLSSTTAPRPRVIARVSHGNGDFKVGKSFFRPRQMTVISRDFVTSCSRRRCVILRAEGDSKQLAREVESSWQAM